jgi:hypothetical protein
LDKYWTISNPTSTDHHHFASLCLALTRANQELCNEAREQVETLLWKWETHQCDLLEVSLALVHEVDLLWLPLWYNLLASLASMMGISVKLSTSMYPFEAI